jgi:hypothetical protein
MTDNQDGARVGQRTGSASSLKMKRKPKTQWRIKSRKSAMKFGIY